MSDKISAHKNVSAPMERPSAIGKAVSTPISLRTRTHARTEITSAAKETPASQPAHTRRSSCQCDELKTVSCGSSKQAINTYMLQACGETERERTTLDSKARGKAGARQQGCGGTRLRCTTSSCRIEAGCCTVEYGTH
jgi:hypothetical protein